MAILCLHRLQVVVEALVLEGVEMMEVPDPQHLVRTLNASREAVGPLVVVDSILPQAPLRTQ